MIFKNLFVKTVVSLGDKLLGANYLSSLHKWNKYDRLSESQLEKIQEENLKKILPHACSTVPYYQKYFLNKDLSKLRLTDFPQLTKELLREQKENLISTKYNVSDLQKNYSSGSSGVQSFSYNEKKSRFFLQGIQSHWYLWSGYRIGDATMQFGMSPKRVFPKNLKDLFYNIHYVNSFSLSKTDHLHLIKLLKKKKIDYLIGYPSAINQLAQTLIDTKNSHPIKGIVSLGDKLFPHFITNFKKAFDSPKIIDTYGCAEGLLMACTNDLDYYYIMSPHVCIEIVDDQGNNVKDGEMGHVLVTSLTNFAMPMIRYKLGDLAIKLPKEKYPINRKYNYPLLEKIVGRETDIVKTSNGKTLIVHSFTGIVEYFPEIKQFKITQNSLEKIKFEYITDSNFNFSDEILKKIETKINLLTENSLDIEFKKVAFIKASPSGKPQIIESNLKQKS
ncbi:MAG: hypothetical protein CVU07_01625 [Bacteroidetes bacterium HGW-Bacteroidetes-23]|nr:MAG: hypothetical protein CVU07_01625 [Bacteroidetes bacterium HGW-Bacteroidetes-23]